MQVDLDERCGKATEEEPVAILLFDLNGFKRFNDTFGHPAGDAMLAQLGEQLQCAVGSDGSAYRIGGDEFAVLFAGGEGRQSEVAKRAAEALTASGKGFELSAAWGAAAIPAEADTATAAMQLADVRMYAQKESRRIAHDDAIEIDAADVTVRLEGPRDREALEYREQDRSDLGPAGGVF
jgi:diguanylate cyclase (GGDEF)-like protein